MPRVPRFALALVVAGLVAAVAPSPAAGQQTAGAAVDGQALVNRYCVTCHNDRLETGGFSFEPLDVGDVAAHPEAWEKVVRKLRAGAMPPRPRPRPDQETYDGFRAWIEGELDAAAASDLNPGRTETFHRLSRTEYRNAVRDLLGLDVSVDDLLPADDTSYGFDNIAGVLGVSPTLMERYLSAARKISRLAVASPVPSPTAETFRIASDLGQDRRMERLPFGTRGGMLLDYNFPEDAEYVFEILPDGPLRIEPHDLEVTIDGERIALLTVGKAPDPDDPRGLYTPQIETLEVRTPVTAGPHEVGVAFLRKTSAEPEGIRKLYLRPFTGEGSGGDSRFQPYVESLTIAGPYESSGARPVEGTPSRDRIFTCRPGAGATAEEETACAREILSTIARRAYRRPVTDEDVERILVFYDRGRAGGSFDSGIEMALRRLLVSPEFLFRVERDPEGVEAGESYRVSDLELASRLSFFLWSSVPDDELLDVAERRELSVPAIFEAQVERMLADPRSEALVGNFAGQWLTLRNAAAVQPDEDEFPDFGEGLRQGFRRETELLFSSVLREGPQCPRPAGRGLHLRGRAARPALRHSQRARQPLPPRGAGGRGAGRPARSRQHPDRDVLRQPDVAGEPGQVGAGEHPRHAAAAAAAGRARPGDGRGRPGVVDARGDGAAPREPGLRELSPPDGSARAGAGELRRDRPLARPQRDPREH